MVENFHSVRRFPYKSSHNKLMYRDSVSPMFQYNRDMTTLTILTRFQNPPLDFSLKLFSGKMAYATNCAV